MAKRGGYFVEEYRGNYLVVQYDQVYVYNRSQRIYDPVVEELPYYPHDGLTFLPSAIAKITEMQVLMGNLEITGSKPFVIRRVKEWLEVV